MFILDPDPDFLPIKDPGSRGKKQDFGSGSATVVPSPPHTHSPAHPTDPAFHSGGVPDQAFHSDAIQIRLLTFGICRSGSGSLPNWYEYRYATSKESYPDLHKSEKSDPDPHKSDASLQQILCDSIVSLYGSRVRLHSSRPLWCGSGSGFTMMLLP